MCSGRAAHFPHQDVDEMLCQQRGSRMRGTSHLKLNTDCRTEWFDLQLAGEGGSDIGVTMPTPIPAATSAQTVIDELVCIEK